MPNLPTMSKVLQMMAEHTSANPITSKDIEERLNICGPAVRDAVRELRRSGEPIVACEDGYYMATSAEEVSDIVQDLEKRAASMHKTAAAIRQRGFDRFRYGCQKPLFGDMVQRMEVAVKGRAAGIRQPGKGQDISVLHVQVDRGADAPGHVSKDGEDISSDVVLQDLI